MEKDDTQWEPKLADEALVQKALGKVTNKLVEQHKAKTERLKYWKHNLNNAETTRERINYLGEFMEELGGYSQTLVDLYARLRVIEAVEEQQNQGEV